MVRRETIAGGRNRRVFVSLFRGNSKLLPEVENLLETHVVPPRWDPAEESNKVKFTVYFSDDHHLAQTNLKPPLSSLSGVGGRLYLPFDRTRAILYLLLHLLIFVRAISDIIL
jgi:hypothetical protein